jgi:Glycosyl transferase family 2
VPLVAETALERCTVIVTPRDLFSVTEECLAHLAANTPEPFDLIVALGGAPEEVRERLESTLGGKARLIFTPGFQNTAELRNLALRHATTRLAACLDTNVFVRPNWLTPLIQCQQETGASLVVPLVLDRDDRIHTAGNDLFITHEGGEAFGSMELRFQHQKVCETTNLTRRPVDFGEVHCELLVVEDALTLGIYDERLREGSDIDSGLTLSRAGRTMLFEPASVVYLHYPPLIKHAMDVPLHRWKWDIPAVMASYRHIHEKWKIDVGGPRRHFKRYLIDVNSRVGPLTQLYPSRPMIFLDRLAQNLLGRLSRVLSLRHRFTGWRTGYYRR